MNGQKEKMVKSRCEPEPEKERVFAHLSVLLYTTHNPAQFGSYIPKS